MNWLLIIIVLLLALCVVNGYRKGFLRMMYSMARIRTKKKKFTLQIPLRM